MTSHLSDPSSRDDTVALTENLTAILARIRNAGDRAGRKAGDITLTAVTKKFAASHITPVLEHGHRVFGENRVQEAAQKWPALKETYPGIKLHLIGPLQTNKTREAVALFDVIETLDREKLARHLADEIAKSGKAPACYMQVNIGEEPQKAGVAPREAERFIHRCRTVHGLSVTGVMGLPPADDAPAPYFALLEKIARDTGVTALSMGMSGDFETAIELGATHIRIGSGIFGPRPV